MEKLKVGDKFQDSDGSILNVLAVTSKRLIYEHNGQENGWAIERFLEHYTPYQEPAPVRKLAAFKSKFSNELKFALIEIKGEDNCQFFQTKEWERIELTPEMFGWEGR